MFLSDQETVVDLLYYQSIAGAVVKLIQSSPETPATIGVHGDWGAGKSSVLSMAKEALEKDKKVVCLWFNGWTFQGFDDAKTVVLETIVEELQKARPNNKKVAAAAKRVLKRIDWLKLAKRAGGLAFTAATGIPTLDQLLGVVEGARAFLQKPSDQVSLSDLQKFAAEAGKYLKEEDSDNIPRQIEKFRHEFAELIREAEIDQLVVLVDDLDRCLPETAIATLEAIRLFLFVPRTAFVIGADETMIEYAVRKHFPDLPQRPGELPYARNYLEKLIQVPFRIPALGIAETRIYVSLLLAQDHLGEVGKAQFQNLLEGARKELQRPWASRGLDAVALTAAYGGKAPPAELVKLLAMGSHISTILAEGTKGNPRQIKRFLNSIHLRLAVAKERGFHEDLDFPKLAKIMLAEAFNPQLYALLSRLATASGADGKVDALKVLEAPSTTSPDVTTTAGAKWTADTAAGVAQPLQNQIPIGFEELVRSEWFKSWVAMEPMLGETDLRPYVFATRDKRSYMGGLAPGSQLENLVEKLLGSRMAVQKLKPEIEALTSVEAEQVFEGLVYAIRSVEDQSTEPNGVQGMALLVEKQPLLQGRLLSFLADFPEAEGGAWLPVSFGATFNDSTSNEAYRQQIQRWTSSSNKSLKSAADAALVLLTPKGR
jgi:hypothetical protein